MATSAYLYPYDPTGTASSNKIVAENHTVQPPNNISDASFVIPRAAPFFGESLIVRTGPTEASTRLEEGKDYYLTHNFVTLSYTLARPIYGSITMINRNFTGDIFLTLQTVGGEYVLDSYSIIEERTRSLYSVYMVTWEQVAGNYPQLPPYDHKMAGDDLVGFGAIADGISSIAAAIQVGGTGGGGTGTGGDGSFPALQAHMNANIAHTKAQIGLGNLDNYKTANEADVLSLSTRTFMTPAMVKYYFDNTLFVTQLQTARQEITELKTRTTATDNRVIEHQDLLNLQANSLTVLAESYDVIREDLDNLVDDVATALEPFEGIPARMGVIETLLIDFTNRIGVIETRNSAADLDLADLKTRMENLEDNAPTTIVPVTSRMYGRNDVLARPMIRVPPGRKAELVVLGSVAISETVNKGYVYSVADANGVIRPIGDLSGFVPLLTVNGIKRTPVVAVPTPVSIPYIEWQTTLDPSIVEISIEGGVWEDIIGATLPEGMTFLNNPAAPGARSRIEYTGTEIINVSIRNDGTNKASLFVSESEFVDQITHGSHAYKIYDENDVEIDPTLPANQQSPSEVGSLGGDDEVGVKFRRIDIVLGPEPSTTPITTGYTYVSGSVTARSGVVFADKTKPNGRVPDPLTTNANDPIARLEDVTVNTVKYPVSYDTVYTESTTKGVPSTGYGLLTVDNTGMADIYLMLSGELSLVTVTDKTDPANNLINVTFPV